MSNINPTYNDRVRYTLYNDNLGSVIITEPIGWQNDEKELSRHKTYFGFVSTFSNSSKYIGSAKDFIKLVYDLEGIEGKIELTREERHPQTDLFVLSYRGSLDMSTLEIEDNKIALKFNSGGIEQLLKARESEAVEIDRLDTIDGKSIPEIQPITVTLEGRRIFLKSKWETNGIPNSLELYTESTAGNVRNQTGGIALTLLSKSYESAQSSLTGSKGNENEGNTGMMFFAVSDKKRRIRLKISKLTFQYDISESRIDDGSWFDISIAKYKDGENYNNPERITLFSLNDHAMRSSSGNVFSTIPFDSYIDIEKGDSLCLEAWQHVDHRGSVSNPFLSFCRITISNIVGDISIEEDSFFEGTNTKAVLAHELVDRLVTIGTNKEKSFYSEFLGRKDIGYEKDNFGAFFAMAHGFWVRQFDKLPLPNEDLDITNLFKPLTTSFKDAVESIDSIFPIGIGFETIGKKERVRLEELSYFFNNNITIKLPNQVKNVKRSTANEYYYSSLEFGSEKGGDYEEAMGLDEFNAKSTFTTVITRITNLFSKVSKYRKDSYGMEFARRKQKSLNDTEDTTYDTDVFLMDLKKGIGDVYEQRKWDDDFEKIPTGVFSPETATNLRFSPLNCLLRHSWWFGGGFKKNINNFVRYASSTANSQLSTKINGNGNEYAENGNIINSELKKARFYPEWIEFEYFCSFEVMRNVEGESLILGKKVKNFYGLVEFTNENNEKERGFLFNLKPNGKGQWKLLKANR